MNRRVQTTMPTTQSNSSSGDGSTSPTAGGGDTFTPGSNSTDDGYMPPMPPMSPTTNSTGDYSMHYGSMSEGSMHYGSMGDHEDPFKCLEVCFEGGEDGPMRRLQLGSAGGAGNGDYEDGGDNDMSSCQEVTDVMACATDACGPDEEFVNMFLDTFHGCACDEDVEMCAMALAMNEDGGDDGSMHYGSMHYGSMDMGCSDNDAAVVNGTQGRLGGCQAAVGIVLGDCYADHWLTGLGLPEFWVSNVCPQSCGFCDDSYMPKPMDECEDNNVAIDAVLGSSVPGVDCAMGVDLLGGDCAQDALLTSLGLPAGWAMAACLRSCGMCPDQQKTMEPTMPPTMTPTEEPSFAPVPVSNIKCNEEGFVEVWGVACGQVDKNEDEDEDEDHDDYDMMPEDTMPCAVGETGCTMGEDYCKDHYYSMDNDYGSMGYGSMEYDHGLGSYGEHKDPLACVEKCLTNDHGLQLGDDDMPSCAVVTMVMACAKDTCDPDDNFVQNFLATFYGCVCDEDPDMCAMAMILNEDAEDAYNEYDGSMHHGSDGSMHYGSDGSMHYGSMDDTGEHRRLADAAGSVGDYGDNDYVEPIMVSTEVPSTPGSMQYGSMGDGPADPLACLAVCFEGEDGPKGHFLQQGSAGGAGHSDYESGGDDGMPSCEEVTRVMACAKDACGPDEDFVNLLLDTYHVCACNEDKEMCAMAVVLDGGGGGDFGSMHYSGDYYGSMHYGSMHGYDGYSPMDGCKDMIDEYGPTGPIGGGYRKLTAEEQKARRTQTAAFAPATPQCTSACYDGLKQMEAACAIGQEISEGITFDPFEWNTEPELVKLGCGGIFKEPAAVVVKVEVAIVLPAMEVPTAPEQKRVFVDVMTTMLVKATDGAPDSIKIMSINGEQVVGRKLAADGMEIVFEIAVKAPKAEEGDASVEAAGAVALAGLGEKLTNLQEAVESGELEDIMEEAAKEVMEKEYGDDEAAWPAEATALVAAAAEVEIPKDVYQAPAPEALVELAVTEEVEEVAPTNEGPPPADDEDAYGGEEFTLGGAASVSVSVAAVLGAAAVVVTMV